MNRSDIKKVIDEWQAWKKETHGTLMARNINIALPKQQALAIIGVRRCGKTYAANSLLPSTGDTFYMNFEDPFFVRNQDVSILDDLLSVYTEYFQKTPHFLLFDEIHNIENWERWARKVVDLKKFSLVITGSSAKMLSSELATSLTGRCLSHVLWPLSFKEFLAFSKKTPANEGEYLGALREYMFYGGFPEVVLVQSLEEKKKILQQYLTDILYKDVIKRNAIRNPIKLEQLTRYYLSNISCLHSYNRLKKAFGINVDTASEYTTFLQEAFLVFEVNRFHRNLKVQARDSKKIYGIDTGLRNANASTPSEDIGKLAENVVYLELRRRGDEITYFSDSGEVDFLTTEFGKPKMAIQVSYDNLGDEKTLSRETSSLLACLKTTKLENGLILTLSREERIKCQDKTIELRPLYKWLL